MGSSRWSFKLILVIFTTSPPLDRTLSVCAVTVSYKYMCCYTPANKMKKRKLWDAAVCPSMFSKLLEIYIMYTVWRHEVELQPKKWVVWFSSRKYFYQKSVYNKHFVQQEGSVLLKILHVSHAVNQNNRVQSLKIQKNKKLFLDFCFVC